MKKNKIIKTLVTVFCGFIVLVLVLIMVYIPTVDYKVKNNPIGQPESIVIKEEKISTTTSLRIPSLKIDTVLESVGLTSQGAVGTPESILKVAWYSGSVEPGLIGNSIVVGHFGFKWGVASIFNNLAKLQKGDKIYIDDGNGQVISFIVQKIQKYSGDAKVPEVFISSDGKSHLNLITCSGFWDKKAKSYSERLVVFTDRE